MSRVKDKKDSNDSLKALIQSILEAAIGDPVFDPHFTLQAGCLAGGGRRDCILLIVNCNFHVQMKPACAWI